MEIVAVHRRNKGPCPGCVHYHRTETPCGVAKRVCPSKQELVAQLPTLSAFVAQGSAPGPNVVILSGVSRRFFCRKSALRFPSGRAVEARAFRAPVAFAENPSAL